MSSKTSQHQDCGTKPTMAMNSDNIVKESESTKGQGYIPLSNGDGKDPPRYSSTHPPPSYKTGDTKRRAPSSPGPASAASINSIMGPAPPKEEKTSFWERWKNDRREAKELKMPTQESSSRWGVKNFAGS